MNKKSLKKNITFVAVVGAVVLTSFVFLPQLFAPNEAKTEMLKKYDLAGLSVKDMVNKLDSITNEKDGLDASITGTRLILHDNDKEYDLKLPSNEFYLSFAPYINEIHPCQTHNLVSCRGELFNKELNVSIVEKDGTVITSQKVKSMSSGFIGIWLPRDIEATLTISYNGLSVTKTITTYAKSDTCITTPLKLS